MEVTDPHRVQACPGNQGRQTEWAPPRRFTEGLPGKVSRWVWEVGRGWAGHWRLHGSSVLKGPRREGTLEVQAKEPPVGGMRVAAAVGTWACRGSVVPTVPEPPSGATVLGLRAGPAALLTVWATVHTGFLGLKK